MEALYPITYAIIEWLQNFSPTLDGFMQAVTFLGTFEFYMLFIPILYWMIDPALGVRILLLLISVDTFGTAFKQLFHQPRPYWTGEVRGLAEETSYGIPSTHASGSIAIWGYLANWIKKSWMWLLFTILVLLIGISRLYLGVHFLHDVLVGWLLGGVILFIFIRSEAGVRDWWQRLGVNTQVGYGFIISLVVIVIGLLVSAVISGSRDPEPWRALAAEARTKTNYFTLSGALFGTLAGLSLMQKYANFQVQGSLIHKIARYLIGIVGVLIVYMGLDKVFEIIAADESVIGYILRYIRYGGVTFWAIFGAPWLFIRLKLAEKK